jgi:hypothetical protein
MTLDEWLSLPANDLGKVEDEFRAWLKATYPHSLSSSRSPAEWERTARQFFEHVEDDEYWKHVSTSTDSEYLDGTSESTTKGESTDSGFDEWLRAVDQEVQAMAGVSYRDLPDWTYRDAYDSGATPKEAAEEALEAGGFYF